MTLDCVEQSKSVTYAALYVVSEASHSVLKYLELLCTFALSWVPVDSWNQFSLQKSYISTDVEFVLKGGYQAVLQH